MAWTKLGWQSKSRLQINHTYPRWWAWLKWGSGCFHSESPSKRSVNKSPDRTQEPPTVFQACNYNLLSFQQWPRESVSNLETFPHQLWICHDFIFFSALKQMFPKLCKNYSFSVLVSDKLLFESLIREQRWRWCYYGELGQQTLEMLFSRGCTNPNWFLQRRLDASIFYTLRMLRNFFLSFFWNSLAAIKSLNLYIFSSQMQYNLKWK